ncbi:MAG: hypothetical protein KC931_22465, partial [Candidatus Omnitrophica bacterium]|nr:hypothetical protein [Candidatus Omnitrophota bacterium]
VAYLFDRDTGELIRTFHNPDPGPGDWFGVSFAWPEEDYICIGAVRDDSHGSNAGAVYVFRIETGELVNTIYSPTPTANGLFGQWIDSFENNILVGAEGDNVNGFSAGKAYLMNPLTGELIQDFANPTPKDGDRFGFWVDSVGQDIVVGARDDDDPATNSGVAHLFDSASGNLLYTIKNPNPNSGDEFGYTVAGIGDSVIAVGCLGDDTKANNAGSAYLFDKRSGELLHSLFSPHFVPNGSFGSVAELDGMVLVGAPNEDENGTDSGAAYLFDPFTGKAIHTFRSPSGGRTNIGNRLSGGGGYALLGALGDDTSGSDEGAAHLFKFDTVQDCVQSSVLDFDCEGDPGSFQSTSETRIRIIASNSGGSGACGSVSYASEDILVDFEVDCSKFNLTTPPSCDQVETNMALELGQSFGDQTVGLLSWKTTDRGVIEVHGGLPFTCVVTGEDLFPGDWEGQGVVLGTSCGAVYLCDGAGIRIESTDSSCPPTPPPT